MRVEIDIFFSETTLPAVFDGIGLQNDAVITFQSLYHLCYYLLFVLLYDTHAVSYTHLTLPTILRV